MSLEIPRDKVYQTILRNAQAQLDLNFEFSCMQTSFAYHSKAQMTGTCHV